MLPTIFVLIVLSSNGIPNIIPIKLWRAFPTEETCNEAKSKIDPLPGHTLKCVSYAPVQN